MLNILSASALESVLKSLIKGLSYELIGRNTGNVMLSHCVVCHSSALIESSINFKDNGYAVYGANGVVGYSDSYGVAQDSILIIKDGASVGRVQRASDKYSVIGTSNYLTAKSHINLDYIFYVLSYFDFSKYVVGSGIPHIYFKDYGCAQIYCPDIEQQNKIAETLNVITSKINIEISIVEKLREQKQYLLSSLFI